MPKRYDYLYQIDMNDSIFQPHYNTTPEMQARLDDIDRQRWLVENMLLMPKHEAWLHREVRVKRASGTTRIEGASMDEAAVGRLVARPPSGRPTDDERANLNAMEAYDFIDFVSDQPDIPIDEVIVRQLNRYFIAGSAETLTPGVYRKGRNTVGSFAPPDQGDVPALMRSFALWLREDVDIHPVIKAGIAHIHLVAIHPFWDGNGRTARGLSALILQRSPFHFRQLLSPEAQLLGVRDEYFGAIERTLGRGFTREYDATGWLEFFTWTVAANGGVLVAELTEWHRMMQQVHERGEADGLASRQVDGLMFAVQAGLITRSDYIDVTGISPVTASRDLAYLVTLGHLRAEGKGRGRVYYPVLSEATPQESVSHSQLPLIVAAEGE
jgi:Fic family protein